MSDSVLEAKTDNQSNQSNQNETRVEQTPVFNVIPHSTLRSGGHPHNSVILVEMNIVFAEKLAGVMDEIELEADEKALGSLPGRLRSHSRYIRGQYSRRIAARDASETPASE
jgi:hypothetical protein